MRAWATQLEHGCRRSQRILRRAQVTHACFCTGDCGVSIVSVCDYVRMKKKPSCMCKKMSAKEVCQAAVVVKGEGKEDGEVVIQTRISRLGNLGPVVSQLGTAGPNFSKESHSLAAVL